MDMNDFNRNETIDALLNEKQIIEVLVGVLNKYDYRIFTHFDDVEFVFDMFIKKLKSIKLNYVVKNYVSQEENEIKIICIKDYGCLIFVPGFRGCFGKIGYFDYFKFNRNEVLDDLCGERYKIFFNDILKIVIDNRG